MSTRATYQITSGSPNFRYSIFLYHHYDGYPDSTCGVAARFAEMLAPNYEKQDNFAERLIREDKYMEITPSHESHSDTEYRYNLFQEENNQKYSTFINVYERQYNENGRDIWVLIFEGLLQEFIDKYYLAEKSLEDS